MNVVAEFTGPPGTIPLGIGPDSPADLEVELETLVPTAGSYVPFFWVWGSDIDGVTESIEDEPAIGSFTLVDRVDTGALYRATWDHEVPPVIRGIQRSDLALLEATGTHDGWHFTVRAPSRDDLVAFESFCRERDVGLRLLNLVSLRTATDHSSPALTEKQREAIELAVSEGYFETPRVTSLQELAETVGITRQSFADRLRRGLNNVLPELLDRR